MLPLSPERGELLLSAEWSDHNCSSAFLMTHIVPDIRERLWHVVCILLGSSPLLLSGFLDRSSISVGWQPLPHPDIQSRPSPELKYREPQLVAVPVSNIVPPASTWLLALV